MKIETNLKPLLTSQRGRNAASPKSSPKERTFLHSKTSQNRTWWEASLPIFGSWKGLFLLLLCLAGGKASAQNIGINATGATPNASTMLDIDASNKGLLIPRVALTAATDATTIATPATSLLVYNLGTGGLSPAGYYYNSGTTGSPVWLKFTTTTADACTQAIPIAQYPTFDAAAPFLLLGALWVGYDATASCWKYNKQANGRGLTDPGNPNTWAVNGTTINYFNGDRSDFPSGTHINNRYNPETMAARYSQDDIMIKTGSFWTDKYESRIINVSGPTWQDNDDNTIMIPTDGDLRGNGQGIPPTWIAFSQRNRGSTGMSWFVAQQASINAGKRLLSSAEWQGAAAGTARTDATGMTVNGETWAAVADQDVSRFGVIGMVGSLWEWVGDWGQYGRDMGIVQGGFKVQQGPYNGDGTWNVNGESYTTNAGENAGAGGFTTGLPAALLRGGSWGGGTYAGVFTIGADAAASGWDSGYGFRCAR